MCQATEPNGCWCMNFPPLATANLDESCLCPTCLRLELQKKESSLSSKEEPDFYIEDGCHVWSESYHLKRGYCCGNECRHCPY